MIWYIFVNCNSVDTRCQ